MSGVPLVIFLLVSVFTVGKVAPCDTDGHTNGCSIPFNLTYFYSRVFTPDCHKHDVCYACGEMYGITRRSCDVEFYRDIRHRCRSDPDIDHISFCLSVTNDYYAAVRLGGGSRYKNNALSWCDLSFVAPCLN